MASKFSTPFMAKSPLYGAYESGAGAKAYVSNRQAFEKLQDDIVSGTKSAISGEEKEDKISFKDSVDFSDIGLGTEKKEGSSNNMLAKCPKGKMRSKINKKCVSKKGAGKEYDK